jgi:hypothetical protein
VVSYALSVRVKLSEANYYASRAARERSPIKAAVYRELADMLLAETKPFATGSRYAAPPKPRPHLRLVSGAD